MQRKRRTLAIVVSLVFLISSFVVLFTVSVYQGTQVELRNAESHIHTAQTIKVKFYGKTELALNKKYNAVLNDPDKVLQVISSERTVDSFVDISSIHQKYITPPRIITLSDLKNLSNNKSIKSVYLSDVVLSSQYLRGNNDFLVPFTLLPGDFLQELNLPVYSGRLPENSDEIVLTYRGAKSLFGQITGIGTFIAGTDPMKTVPFQNARFVKKYRVVGILKPLPDEFYYTTFGPCGAFGILPEGYVPLPERPSTGIVNNKTFFYMDELFVMPEKGEGREAISSIKLFLQKFDLQDEEIYPQIFTTYKSIETILSLGAIRNKLKFIFIVGIFLLLLSIFDSAVFTKLSISLEQREIIIKRAIGASTNMVFGEFLIEGSIYIILSFVASLLVLLIFRQKLASLNIAGSIHLLTPVAYSMRAHPIYIGVMGVLITFLIIAATFIISVKLPFAALSRFPPMSSRLKETGGRRLFTKIVVAALIAISVSVLLSSAAIKYYTEKKIMTSESEVAPDVVRIFPARTYLSMGKTISVTIGAPRYTLQDYFALRDFLKGKAVVGFRHSLPTIEPKSKVRYAEATPDMDKIYGIAVSKGRFISDSDIGKKVCVVGSEIAEKEHLKLNGVFSIHVYNGGSNLYRIIGILDKENPLIDQTVFYAASEKGLTNEWFAATKNYTGSGIFLIKANNPEDRLTIAKEALAFLNKRHPDKNPGAIYDIKKYVDIVLISSTSLYTLLSIFILLALLSAFLSLSALLFIEVIRRTREIGIKKAIGATKKNIIKEFTLNGLKTTIIALTIGIPIGILTALVMEKLKGWELLHPY